MKKGLLFFLNLHSYVKIARICLIPAAVFLFFARGIVLMATSLIILGILLVISLIRAPFDEDVLKGIKQFHDEFQKRIAADAETKQYNEAKALVGYRHGGKVLLRRQVDGDYIYSYIIDIAIARTDSGFIFYTNELNLLRNDDSRRNQYSINSANFQYTYEPLPNQNAAVLEFLLLETNIHISVLVENDYHLRDFLEILKSFDK